MQGPELLFTSHHYVQNFGKGCMTSCPLYCTWHRCLLLSCCTILLESRNGCKLQADQPLSTRTVHLGNPGLSPTALKAVLVFMYTERLDVGIEEIEPVLRVMRRCRLKCMIACVVKEQRTLRYHSKSLRKDEAGPRRYHVCCSFCLPLAMEDLTHCVSCQVVLKMLTYTSSLHPKGLWGANSKCICVLCAVQILGCNWVLEFTTL